MLKFGFFQQYPSSLSWTLTGQDKMEYVVHQTNKPQQQTKLNPNHLFRQPQRQNVTTFTVGLRNSHTHKNLTKTVTPRVTAGNAQEEEESLQTGLWTYLGCGHTWAVDIPGLWTYWTMDTSGENPLHSANGGAHPALTNHLTHPPPHHPPPTYPPPPIPFHPTPPPPLPADGHQALSGWWRTWRGAPRW